MLRADLPPSSSPPAPSAAVPGVPAASAAPSHHHLSVERTHRFTVALPLAEAFPLFEPIGEKAWAPDWDPVFATNADAQLSDRTVFTRAAPHGDHMPTSIWLITRYDPAGGLIEYRAIVPGVRVARITVRCTPDGGASTTVDVTYLHTSLSDDGDRFVRDMTEGKFRSFIEDWAIAIRTYLAQKR